MGADRWDEQVGSVADEAGRLLESLRRSAAETAAHSSVEADPPDAVGDESSSAAKFSEPQPSGMPDDGPAVGAEPGSHDPFCTWCPLCRGAAVVRGLSPETLTRLADLASLAATVFAELASSRPGGDPPASRAEPADPANPAGPAESGRAAAGPAARRPGRPTPTPSRPIPVRDADDPQEAPRG